MAKSTIITNSSNSIDLSDKTYLVTGAANGIGRSLAIALTQVNANVVLLDKDNQGLDSLYDLINSDPAGGESVLVHQDLTVLTQHHCDLLNTQISQTFEKLDGIIHCAAETGNLSPIEYYADEDWSAVIKANLHSPYLLTRTLLPLVNHDLLTSVIFSSTPQALKSSAFWGAFGVSQQGLKALVETWSQELEHSNIRMFLLDPGKVNTRYITRLFPGINPNQFPDSNTIAQKYLQLLNQPQPEFHGKFIQIENLELKLKN